MSSDETLAAGETSGEMLEQQEAAASEAETQGNEEAQHEAETEGGADGGAGEGGGEEDYGSGAAAGEEEGAVENVGEDTSVPTHMFQDLELRGDSPVAEDTGPPGADAGGDRRGGAPGSDPGGEGRPEGSAKSLAVQDLSPEEEAALTPEERETRAFLAARRITGDGTLEDAVRVRSRSQTIEPLNILLSRLKGPLS